MGLSEQVGGFQHRLQTTTSNSKMIEDYDRNGSSSSIEADTNRDSASTPWRVMPQ